MNFRALLSEFVGTFAIVFVGVGAIVADHVTNGALGLTGIALAFGFVVAAMATATAQVGGGHLNPAVSFGMLISGRMKLWDCLGYTFAQCCGGVAAMVILTTAVSPLALEAVNYGITAVGEGATPRMAFVMEIVLTFFLVFTAFGTVVDQRAPKLGALLAGFAVAMCVLVGGPVSGAALNPARWLGPAVISGDFYDWWVYAVGPLAGGLLAAVLYSQLLLRNSES